MKNKLCLVEVSIYRFYDHRDIISNVASKGNQSQIYLPDEYIVFGFLKVLSLDALNTKSPYF